jgi:hypothetical protein
VSRLAPSLALVVAAAGCSREPPVPSTLIDGSPARPPPVRLEGVAEPTIATRVRILRVPLERGSLKARCVGPPDAPGTVVVQRVGVSGTSVTFRGPSPQSLYGCDTSTARPTARASWCGRSFARLHAGRLRDPRLSVSCRTVGDEPLGFAWIEPGRLASHVVVARAGFHEVYPVAGDLPVRITTGNVDLGRSSAEFAVSEHARDGRRLRSYELEARVSG